MDDLDAVLQGEAEVVEQEQAEPEQETAEATGETEDTTPPVDESTTPEPENKEVLAFKAKAQDEKRKRQDLEAKLREIEERNKPKDDDYWDNPKGVLEKMRSELRTEFKGDLYGITEELTRDAHEDYDDTVNWFMAEMAETNQGILETARSKRNPHQYIYKEAKRLKKMQEIGDVDEYLEKERAKIRAEVEAELKKPKTPSGSLANERAAGGNSRTPEGQESLNDIFGR